MTTTQPALIMTITIIIIIIIFVCILQVFLGSNASSLMAYKVLHDLSPACFSGFSSHHLSPCAQYFKQIKCSSSEIPCSLSSYISVHAIPSALSTPNLQVHVWTSLFLGNFSCSLNPGRGIVFMYSHESSPCIVIMCVLLYCDCFLTCTCFFFTINLVSVKIVTYLCISVPQLHGIL